MSREYYKMAIDKTNPNVTKIKYYIENSIPEMDIVEEVILSKNTEKILEVLLNSVGPIDKEELNRLIKNVYEDGYKQGCEDGYIQGCEDNGY